MKTDTSFRALMIILLFLVIVPALGWLLQKWGEMEKDTPTGPQ